MHLDWIPALPDESLENYAARLASAIDTSAPFYLIGLSFGGMLATEIAKKLTPVHTFLISSTTTFKGLPWYYRMAGSLRLQKLLPVKYIKKFNTVGLKLLGAKGPKETSLLRQLVTDSDPYFIKWALTCILEWRNTERPVNLTHIHGTTDYILPLQYTTKPDLIINGGGHFMVYVNAQEILRLMLNTGHFY
ncbi:alpha/beta hydrolase [Pedobacter lusitanus]|uniref:alpha/beta hydrolase n=1 Tax=Pedobacter lusitanus TaxID=1503925 RepID=UPI0006991584|nr:alpha/beta hydrolase [Pedobacter lusitanus]